MLWKLTFRKRKLNYTSAIFLLYLEDKKYFLNKLLKAESCKNKVRDILETQGAPETQKESSKLQKASDSAQE